MRCHLLSRTLAATIAMMASAANTAAQTQFVNADYGLVPLEQQYLYVLAPTPTPIVGFSFDLTRPFDFTTPVLDATMAYRVRISGRGGVGPLDGILNSNNSRPDAAFYFCWLSPWSFENLDVCQVPGNGFGVSAWDGVQGRRPSPDVYNPDHVYDYFIRGRGAGLFFTFRDDPYGDNVSNFYVDIAQLGALTDPTVVPEPSTGALVAVSGLVLLLGARRVRRRRAEEHRARRVTP